MAVRYPGRTAGEGAAPSTAASPATDASAPLARPTRLPRHTPARGAAPVDAPRASDGITVTVPPATAPLVREALALALPGVAVTVVTDRAIESSDSALASSAPASSALAPAWSALRRTQQLVAASDTAMRLQHALANPLTALLFEAQLLEMEEALPPALAEAVGRILTQCRRTIEVARRLDTPGAGPGVGPGVGLAATSPRHDIRNPL